MCSCFCQIVTVISFHSMTVEPVLVAEPFDIVIDKFIQGTGWEYNNSRYVVYPLWIGCVQQTAECRRQRRLRVEKQL